MQRRLEMRRFINFISCIAFMAVVVSWRPHNVFAVNLEENVPQAWLLWLKDLKSDMIRRGISPKTIQKAYGNRTYYHKIPEVVQHDNKQPEFVLTSAEYLNRQVNRRRVDDARSHYQQLQNKYSKLEETYHVPLNYLIAFWGLETNFGQNKGKYHIVDGLTNLSYYNQRTVFFKDELFNILKIMEKYDLSEKKLKGSWAGAMGHFQFMPSTFNAYGVDYDQDGKVDVWDSFDDAIASAAHFLSSIGWKQDEPWGIKVSLPWNFDYDLAGYQHPQEVEKWVKSGVRTQDGELPGVNLRLKASIIVPDGHKGQAYMVFDNFRKIMIWNRSENYALAVGILADYIVCADKVNALPIRRHDALSDEDVKQVQKFANNVLHLNLKEDGQLGPETKKAVKELQHMAKLQQDGYPDYRLLNKIRNYDPQIEFGIPPLPPGKPKAVLK